MYSTLSEVWEFHFVLLWCSHWVFLSLFSIKVSINCGVFLTSHLLVGWWRFLFLLLLFWFSFNSLCCCCKKPLDDNSAHRIRCCLFISVFDVRLFATPATTICTPTDWLTTTAQIEKFLQTDHGVEQVEIVCWVMAVVVFCLLFDYCCCFCCCWLWGGGGGGGVIVDVGVIVFSACQNIITKQQQQFHYPPGQQREKNRPRNMPTSRPTYPPDQPAQAHTQPPATLQSLFNERKMITKGKTTDLRQPQPSKILHFWRQYR